MMKAELILGVVLPILLVIIVAVLFQLFAPPGI